ncbi:MAG TPA: TIGR04563 family protein [Anaeromyxobacter sp.]|nr:TIGR04563 family protein [Anaeromyxobacter sp.]
MGIPDKRKQSLYFPEDMLREIQAEATRQDRSLSWIVQHAWNTARSTIGRIPGMGEIRPSATASETGKAPIP